MTVLTRLLRSQRALIIGSVAGAVLWTAAFAIPVWFVLGSRAWAAVVATVVLATSLWRRRAVFEADRVALWLEERHPELQYTLITAIDSATGSARSALEHKVAPVGFERTAYRAAARLALVPLVIAGATILATIGMTRLAARQPGSGVLTTETAEPKPGDSSIRLTVTLTPPPHTRLPVERLPDPIRVAGVTGSRIRIDGSAPANEISIQLDSRSLAVATEASGWRTDLTMPNSPAVVRVRTSARERLILLEPRADSLPVVRLDLPERDTLLSRATGTLPLAASFHDDFGLAETWWELIVSRGDGENFEFRTVTLDRAAAGSAKTTTRSLVLPLDSLTLSPGDIVLLRAVARDGNTSPGPGIAGSDPRTIRIAANRQDDSLDIEVLPPPEPLANLLSQRMLILLTEALEKKRARLARSAVVTESARIGRDQTSLRRQIGDLVFARLEDLGETGEHSHDDGHDHSAMTPEELLRAAEAANRHATGESLDFAAGESPVIAVNRPLLEAYHAMWDATRELNQGEPRAALPHMYAALDAIQRARLADRIYLRGRTRPVVVDMAKVRLIGKRDGIAPGPRTPQASLDPAVKRIAERFDRALDLLGQNRDAAIDSLLLLRAELLTDHPRIAAPLAQAIDTLRTDHDATAALARARRAIGQPTTARSGFRRWSTAP